MHVAEIPPREYPRPSPRLVAMKNTPESERHRRNRELHTKMVESKTEGSRLQARNLLVEENMGLVQKVLWSSQGFKSLPSHVQDDMLQEAYLILVKKVEQWDPTKGKLSTFVNRAIWGEMVKQLKFNQQVVHYPDWILAEMKKAGEFPPQPEEYEDVVYRPGNKKPPAE